MHPTSLSSHIVSLRLTPGKHELKNSWWGTAATGDRGGELSSFFFLDPYFLSWDSSMSSAEVALGELDIGRTASGHYAVTFT
jgi:hypothetical protein